MSCPEYALIRSARRTLAIQIRRDGLVLGEAVAAIHLSTTPAAWHITGLRTGTATEIAMQRSPAEP